MNLALFLYIIFIYNKNKIYKKNEIKIQQNFRIPNTIFKDTPLLINHLVCQKENLIDKFGKKNFRAYKDESTSSFNTIFFENENILQQFTNYCYHRINYDINSNINDELKDIGKDILQYKEDILLIFKGGNIINYFIKDAIKNFNQKNIQNAKFDKFTKISDTDFTIYILNNGEVRFNLLYIYVSHLLYSSLLKIREEFEKILVNIPNPNPNLILKDIKNFTNGYELIDILNQKMFDQINIDLNNLHKDMFINKKYNTFQTNFIIKQRIYSDCIIGTKYIKVLQTFKENNENYRLIDLDELIKEQRIIIEIILENNLIELQIQEFYNKEKLKKFINLLDKNLSDNYTYNGEVNTKIEDYLYYKFQNPLVIEEYLLNETTDLPNQQVIPRNQLNNNSAYELNLRNNQQVIPRNQRNNNSAHELNLSNKQVKINKAKDFIVKNINNYKFSELLIRDKNYFHIITVSSFIYNYMSESHIVNFDLFRIKFNVLLNKIKKTDLITSKSEKIKLNIPSEFLDVSIPKYNDLNLNHIKESKNKNLFTNLNFGNYKNILTYSIETIIDDLNILLHKQNIFSPWFDNKYEKRLDRLIFLITYKIINNYTSRAIGTNGKNKFKTYFTNFQANLIEICESFKSYKNLNNNIYKDRIFRGLSYFNEELSESLKNNPIVINQYYNSDNFFKIKYETIVDRKNENFIDSFKDYNDMLLEHIFRIVILYITDKDLYIKYVKLNLKKYNFIFNNKEQELDFINGKYLNDFIKFFEKLIEKYKVYNKLIFENYDKYLVLNNNNA